MSPEVRERLSRPTTTRKPVKYVPLTKKEVRDRVPTSDRPKRKVNGNPKRLTNTQLTDELNKIEKQLNTYGYTLRDSAPVKYHEHRPNRAVLEKQEKQARKVADVRPKRAPLSSSQLRDKVRRAAKPPRRAPTQAGGNVNQLWAGQSAAKSSVANFDWRPAFGEDEIASAYLDTTAGFSAELDNYNLDMNGSVVARAGVTILGERLDALRLDAQFSSHNGAYRTDVELRMLGYDYPLIDVDQSKTISVYDVYEPPLSGQDYRAYATKVPIAGYPVDVVLTVTPTVSVGYGAEITGEYLFGYITPNARLDLTLEAYADFSLASVGAGGSVALLEVTPNLMGIAYFPEVGGTSKPTAEIHGAVWAKWLTGRIYLFLTLGWGPLSKRFEYEMLGYEGWSHDFYVFRGGDAN
ncbi:MAG: hypothetical protein HC927_02575 [Deltaproteobacteria bacterium]|nr:hypothetical protein [Deltaproteobacteria bacterium]